MKNLLGIRCNHKMCNFDKIPNWDEFLKGRQYNLKYSNLLYIYLKKGYILRNKKGKPMNQWENKLRKENHKLDGKYWT